MDDFMFFEPSSSDEENATQLIMNIDRAAEQDFLSKIGGANARRRDVAALVDLYNGTHIGTLCFAGSDQTALQIWAERCRAIGLFSLLTVDASMQTLSELGDALCTDGILLDCRRADDLSVVGNAAQYAADGLLYLLVKDTAILQNSDLQAVSAVIVCADGNCCENVSSAIELLSKQKDFAVFACVSNLLCNANGKVWRPTPEILNGIAVSCLAKGCNGLWLDGFCADIFDPDSLLFDIYETCGDLDECVGAKRRHIMFANEQKLIMPGADYRITADIAPAFDGAPVCLVLAVDGQLKQDAIAVFADENETEYTGEPYIISRNEKGRLCENQCLPADVKCFEFYLGNHFSCAPVSLRIHNNTNKDVILCWCELSVNV